MLRKISCLSFLVKRHQPYVGIEITVPGIEIAVQNLIFWTFNLGLRCAGAFGLLSWGRAECIFHPELSVIKYIGYLDRNSVGLSSADSACARWAPQV